MPDLSHVSRGCSNYLSNGQRWVGTLVALRMHDLRPIRSSGLLLARSGHQRGRGLGIFIAGKKEDPLTQRGHFYSEK